MAHGVPEMLQELQSAVPQASPADVKRELDQGDVDVVVDVREPDEFAGGHVPGAINIPRGVLEIKADARVPATDARLSSDPDARVVVYCGQAPGFRALSAADTLARMGYANVVAMPAGTNGWQEAGLPLE
ncbi:MAG: rhodanese-like domain-containing protein [Actinomycetota bacterium]